ncbi:MAG TPA: hypothetical protein VGQ64_06795 [Candidatus Limnocylindrales bacterium]|nr:hypothetical protein [Candidatus Limnocylindrales bacterium]
MADSSRYGGPDAGGGRDSTGRIPGWLKTLGIVAVIVVLLLAAMMLVGGGHQIPAH